MDSKGIVVVILAALLASCASQPQISEDQRRDLMAAAIINKCTAVGFKPETDAFAQCVNQEVDRANYCARVQQTLRSRFYSNLSRESAKPGATFIDSANRSLDRSGSMVDYGC